MEKPVSHVSRRRWPALARLPLTLLASFTLVAQAAPVASVSSTQRAAGSASPMPSKTASEVYTLKKLGAQYPLSLHGVDSSNTLNFSIRNDRVVTGARLDLNYAYSPALLSDISHINVLVNDEVAATIPVPRDTAGKQLQKSVEIPSHLIAAYNDLRVQLIGHYTLQCEDPLHSSLWANIGNESTLNLTTEQLQLSNDLSHLPLPFFDKRDMGELVLPFVFQTSPDNASLVAAGTLSSWFGALAGYRGASFPASVERLPAKGNAVVFASGQAVSSLTQEKIDGPTLSIVTNPNDANGKLLLVLGRDGKDLKRTAAALALGSQTLSGTTAVITKLANLKPRQPYDAPKWLRSDRPVSFGELAGAKGMNVSGFSPDLIRIDVRVPPDLFGWQQKEVPIDLRYRYTPQSTSLSSAMLFSVDDQFVKSIPLFALERIEGGDKLRAQVLPDESLPMRAQLDVPLELLKSRGQLQFRYMYDYIKQGECRDIIVDNMRGVIEPESTIDISDYPHFIAMPDLRAFSESGFPFTRMADLSETAVILGDKPSEHEYSTYLGVMGRMGESTGYPVVGVTVARDGRVSELPNKDLLVISSGENQPLLKKWADRLPGSYEKGGQFSISDLIYRTANWQHLDPREDKREARSSVAYSSDGVSAIVAGFESPLAAKRSVVLLVSNKPEGLGDVMNALQRGEHDGEMIQGSLSVIRGQNVDALTGDQIYYAGSLPLLTRIDWWISSMLPGYTLAKLVAWALVVLSAIALALTLVRGLLGRRRFKRVS